MEENAREMVVKEYLLKIHLRKLEELEHKMLDEFDKIEENEYIPTFEIIEKILILEARIENEKKSIIRIQKQLKEELQ